MAIDDAMQVLTQAIKILHLFYVKPELQPIARDRIEKLLHQMHGILRYYNSNGGFAEGISTNILLNSSYNKLEQSVYADNSDSAISASHEILNELLNVFVGSDSVLNSRSLIGSAESAEYENTLINNNYSTPATDDHDHSIQKSNDHAKNLGQGFFYYSLLGNFCNNNQCLKNSEVTLRFSVDIISKSAVKVFGNKLKDVEYVDISVIAEGFTKSKDMQGQWVRRLWLSKDKEPNKPTTIDFHYIASDTEKSDTGFFVRIDYRGRPVYHFWLDVSIVDALDCNSYAAQAPLELDLDKLQAEKSRQPCDLTISLAQEGGRINIYAAKFKDGLLEEVIHEISDIEINKFIQIVNTAKDRIDAIANQPLWNQWTVDEANEFFRAKLIEINKISDTLLNVLVFNDEKFDTLIKAVEGLKSGSRITICTNTIGFPWDILRTRASNDDASNDDASNDDALDSDRFWGIRYRIECLRNNRKTKHSDRVKPKITTNSQGSSLVCLVDNSIDENHAQSIVMRLQPQVVPNVVEQCKNKKSALEKAGPEKCVYILCHGAADQPLQADGHLELELNACPLNPDDLVSTECYQNKPLIIINACSGTVISPFAATSFSEMFSLKNAQGVVGSLFLVPTNCATKMGIALLEGYLINQYTIGDTMAAIRREWLAAYNPIPLFYQLQCNMDAKL